jgi:hypothetical protein
MNFYLTASKHGVLNETGTFTLSPDGETLTFDYVFIGGKYDGNHNTVVYHRWNMID